MKQTLEEAAKENILFNHRTVDRNLSGKDLAKFGEINFVQGAEWQKEQSPWISVKDKLPPIGVDVIHTDINTSRLYCGQVNKVGTLILGWTPCGEVTATHYMLIPPFSFDDILEANRDVLERMKNKGD